MPLLEGSYTVRLDEKYKATNIPFSAAELANAYVLRRKTPGATIAVDELFNLVLELRPVLSGAEAEALPDGEAGRIEAGESILLKRARTAFPVKFEARGGRISW